MIFKVLLYFCCFHAVASGSWKIIARDICVGARNSHYKEFTYRGRDTFIIAMKLVHKKGQIGCIGWARSNWGCYDQHPTNIIVTDAKNKRMYPSSTLINLREGGWYDLPGYGQNSPELVFSDPGFRYLYNGQKMRMWYGEDLYNSTEDDNHGYTCMDVYVYAASI